jgi:putative glycosyltransferase (TIGR04372 family)
MSKIPSKCQKYLSRGTLPKLFLLPIALAFVSFVILLRPLIIIKFQKFKFPFGSYVSETELIRLQIKSFNSESFRKKIIIFILPDNAKTNSFMDSLWRRNLFVFSGDFGWLVGELSHKLKLIDLQSRSSPIDFFGLLTTPNNPPIFSPNEIETGKKFLQLVCQDRKFICLNVRDGKFHGNLGEKEARQSYRNSDIQNYVEAAETLGDMGYTVFRMGANVAEPLVSSHPRLIDYATNGMRTEFLDVFLGANCFFCISTGSGWDNIPTIFRRPVMYVNYLPIFGQAALALPITIYPKLLVDPISHNTLSFEEQRARNISSSYKSAAFADAGVQIRDLSSEELVEAVTEMAQRVEGTFVETPEQKEMQSKLKHILSTHPKLQPSPNYYPIRAQFASCFLSRYPNFLDGLD